MNAAGHLAAPAAPRRRSAQPAGQQYNAVTPLNSVDNQTRQMRQQPLRK